MRVAHDNRGKETALPVLVENRRWKHYGARILSNGRPRSYLYASAYSLCSAVCFSRQPLFYNRQTNYREYFFAAVKFLFVNKFYSANDIRTIFFFPFFFFLVVLDYPIIMNFSLEHHSKGLIELRCIRFLFLCIFIGSIRYYEINYEVE